MLMQTLGDEFKGQVLVGEFQHLQDKVVVLGRLVESAIIQSVEALQRRASESSHSLITLDHQITKKRFAIEMDCVTLIANEGLADYDLRTIASMLEIATELERIGDYITDISGIHLTLVKVEQPLLDLLLDIQSMGAVIQKMLQRALDALVKQDVALARAVHAEDDVVDALYRQVYESVLTFMKGQPRTAIKQARHLARIARNLERSADRVTNICEWVVFSVTGEMDHTELTKEPVGLFQEELS